MIRPRFQRIGVSMLLVLATAGTVSIAVVATRPTTRIRLLGGYGNRESGPLPAGHTLYAGAFIGVRHERDLPIRLVSVTPVIAENSSQARIRVLLCQGSAGPEAIGTSARIRPYCNAVRSFRPASLDLSFGHDSIVFAITPRRRGVVDIRGSQVIYEHDGVQVYQHVGIELRQTTS